ncbi:hypothetical protein QAD02_023863 [Eretmocerus hayati]|uniref:Uncharacterized protein n=1 Tax=Eretmocerus hayati TaxID=131215 RepID=A0ACC2PY55_9HYME|nr:hypothetical protein QAD02_023863 [Eretmocerus hayati]
MKYQTKRICLMILSMRLLSQWELHRRQSRERSMKEPYENHVTWRRMKKIFNTGEKVLLAYFQHLGKSLALPTSWVKWSMLKTMIEENKHMNIYRYQELKGSLKQKNEGYACKESPTLSSEDIQGFLVNAPNRDHLADKVYHHVSSHIILNHISTLALSWILQRLVTLNYSIQIWSLNSEILNPDSL